MNEERREKITLFFCLVADFFLFFFSLFFWSLGCLLPETLLSPLTKKTLAFSFFFHHHHYYTHAIVSFIVVVVVLRFF